MSTGALQRTTASLEEQLGPCLLVLRCYELLENQSDAARKMAEAIVLSELTRLSAILKQAPSSTAAAEHFLRAIYVLDAAHRPQEAQLTAQRFVAAFRRIREKGPLKDAFAFRLGAAAAILQDCSSDALELLDEKAFPGRLARSCVSNSAELLEDIFEELDEAIIEQENKELLHAWDDTWLYIVLRRVRKRLERLTGERKR